MNVLFDITVGWPQLIGQFPFDSFIAFDLHIVVIVIPIIVLALITSVRWAYLVCGF